jgi:quercetin dioxygenase-like cupin family protein
LFFQYADATPVQMAPGLIRKTLVSGGRLMICRFDLDDGVVIPCHAHPHDQAGYVVSGKIRITVDGKSCDLNPGDSYFAPSGALHSAVALEVSVVVDTFCPPRVDYRAHPVDDGPTIQTIISNEINKNP